MNFNNYDKKKGGAYVLCVVCAFLFCSFTFVYLYFYQSDIIAVAQHILSGGATSYNSFIGALIITSVLMLLQIGIASFVRIPRNYYALTFCPSALLLSLLSSMMPTNDGIISLGGFPWLTAACFILWGCGCAFLKRISIDVRIERAIVRRRLSIIWRNLLIMSSLFLFVCFSGNNDAIMHYRMRVETYMLEGNFNCASKVGNKSQDADAWLTMLRIYSLAREERLPEELFKYPIHSTSSSDIVPMDDGIRCLLYSNDSIYKFLGGRPVKPMKVMTYLDALLHSGIASDAVKDYLLCGYLIDRDLDAFAKALPTYYEINNKLPLHYREALTLYTHIRANPIIIYHDSIMDTDYEDLQRLEKESASYNARKIAVYSQYAHTYWWYYEYGL